MIPFGYGWTCCYIFTCRAVPREKVVYRRMLIDFFRVCRTLVHPFIYILPSNHVDYGQVVRYSAIHPYNGFRATIPGGVCTMVNEA